MTNPICRTVAWVTIVSLVLFLVTPGHSMQDEDGSKGLLLTKEGEAQYSRLQFAEAINTFQEAQKYITRQQHLIRVHLGLARAYFALGDNKKTEQALEEMFKLKGDATIQVSEYAGAFLKIYQRLRQKYTSKRVAAPEEKKVQKLGVIEKPLTGQRAKRKRKFPLLLILGGVAVLAVVAVVILGGKKDDNMKKSPIIEDVSIHLESTPSGAEVYVDGTSQGLTTPCDITVTNIFRFTVTKFMHEIRLVKPEWGEAKTRQSFNPSQNYSLSAMLSPYTYESVVKWGSKGSGNGQFNEPRDLAFDSSNNVYVTDFNNHRVQKFDANGTFLGKFGSRGSNKGKLDGPSGIAIDSNDNIYVAEHNNSRVQKFNSNFQHQAMWGRYGNDNGQFSRPTDVHVDKNNRVYVTDNLNHRIQVFNTRGVFQFKWGKPGSNCSGTFNNVAYLTTDKSGNVYVTDRENGCIQKFTATGTFVKNIVSSPYISGSQGIAVAANNYIFLADKHHIHKYDADGSSISSMGNAMGYPVWFPYGIAIDKNNNIYVTETGYNRTQKFRISNNTYSNGTWTQSSKKALSSQKHFLNGMQKNSNEKNSSRKMKQAKEKNRKRKTKF